MDGEPDYRGQVKWISPRGFGFIEPENLNGWPAEIQDALRAHWVETGKDKDRRNSGPCVFFLAGDLPKGLGQGAAVVFRLAPSRDRGIRTCRAVEIRTQTPAPGASAESPSLVKPVPKMKNAGVPPQIGRASRRAPRVFRLARELGMTSKALLDQCHAHGLDLKNHMSSVSISLAAAIRSWFVEATPEIAVKTAAHTDLGKDRTTSENQQGLRGGGFHDPGPPPGDSGEPPKEDSGKNLSN